MNFGCRCFTAVVTIFALFPFKMSHAQFKNPPENVIKLCNSIDSHLEESFISNGYKEWWIAFSAPTAKERENRWKEFWNWGTYRTFELKRSAEYSPFVWNDYSESQHKIEKTFDETFERYRKLNEGARLNQHWNLINKFVNIEQFICTPYTLSFGCRRAFRYDMKISKPTDLGGAFMLAPEFRRSFSNATFGKFWVESANLMRIRLNEFRVGEFVSNDFFADLFFVAKQITSDEAMQNDLVWTTIGMFGTQGAWLPIFNKNFRVKENESSIDALSFISLILGVLDGYSYSSTQKLYTMPPQIRTSCNFGKPYHFWMAAYLGYAASHDKGVHAKDSMLASFLIGKSYELYSTTNGRAPATILNQDRFSDHNNTVRTGIGIKLAAAYFGATQGAGTKTKEIDLDAILMAQIKNAKNSRFFLKKHKVSDLGGFVHPLEMERMMAPKIAYQELSHQLKHHRSTK